MDADNARSDRPDTATVVRQLFRGGPRRGGGSGFNGNQQKLQTEVLGLPNYPSPPILSTRRWGLSDPPPPTLPHAPSFMGVVLREKPEGGMGYPDQPHPSSDWRGLLGHPPYLRSCNTLAGGLRSE